MPLGRDSSGVQQLKKRETLQSKNSITEEDIKKLQKTLKGKLSKQIKDITTNFNQFLANDTKGRSKFEKAYKATEKLQQSVMNRLKKAVDEKNREMVNPKTVNKLYRGEIVDKLREMKDFTSEIEPTIKAIHEKHEKENSEKMTKLRDEIKQKITERIDNIKTNFAEINNGLETMLKQSDSLSVANYETVYEMIANFSDYGNSIRQSYVQGTQFITMNLDKFVQEQTTSGYDAPKFSNPNSPNATEINRACSDSTKALKQASEEMKKIQQKTGTASGGNAAKTPDFITQYLNKINDPLLKLTFIFGAEHSLVTRIIQYMESAKKELKEYENTASKLHTTAADWAKKIGIIFLKLVPAMIGMATGLGSTLGAITDFIESLGWLLNAVAYAASDIAGIDSELRGEIEGVNNDISKRLLESTGIQ